MVGAVALFVAGLALSYLLLPLAHYLLAVPPGFRYISKTYAGMEAEGVEPSADRYYITCLECLGIGDSSADSDVPTSFAWELEHSDNTNLNATWSLNNSIGRWYVSQGEGTNGLDFVGPDDPRRFTDSGIEIKHLYTADDVEGDPRPRAHVGLERRDR